MRASETICIGFGNWIGPFYTVYVLAALAVVAVAAAIDWGVNRLRASQVVATAKVARGPRVIESRV